MQNLDLQSLEIFRHVAVEGSVTKAAAKLNRVQSNISTRIKQLEERINKDLFIRKNRKLTLTPEGQILLTYAERLLQLSLEATEALNEWKPSGVLKIGAMESTAAARLPEILSLYNQLYPEVKVELKTDTAGGLITRLTNFDIDVAFIAEPVVFENISTQPVFEEKLVLVVPQSFPPLMNVDEISGKTVIAFEQGCAYRRYLEEWMLECGIVPGGFIAISSYLAILANVSAGTGFAIVPQSVLDTVNTKGTFQIYPLPGKYSKIKTLLTSRVDYRSVKLDTLSELLPLP
ncbi:LysR substrate-binding domain-containing protein [Kiloniella sp.]|uniref:LysR family transcriptional regulator n=1 Tax=Kiloniella sp. TaxID=1938587 RepID=UPI003B0247F2